MKVILLEDVKGIGKRHEVKDISDGYARNFLIPNKLAEIAMSGALKELEYEKAKLEKEDEALRRRLSEIARLITERHLEFDMRTDGKGGVFGSVTKEMILKGLRDAGFVSKERVEIKLDHPLKELGEHSVGVDLKKGIVAKLKVLLRPQQ